MRSKKHLFFSAFAFSLLLISGFPGNAIANVPLQIEDLSVAGEGCPSINQMNWTYDEVHGKLTINFDDFRAWMNGDLAQSNLINACTISYVVRPKNGRNHFNLLLNRVEYMGYIYTEDSVQAQIRRRHKFGDQRPGSLVTNFDYGYDDDFYIVDQHFDPSFCQESATVVNTTRIRLRGRPSGFVENELIVDTAQYSGSIVFWLTGYPC